MRKTKKVIHNIVDVCLLSAGVVDLPIFRSCLQAIKREIEGVAAGFQIFFNGAPQKDFNSYKSIVLETIPNAQIRSAGANMGFPKGANATIRMGSAPLVLFVTDDIILHEGSLKTLLETMQDANIGLCGLKLTFPKDSVDPNRPAGRVQHIGHAIDLHGQVTHPLIGWRPENPKCNISREVQSVTGAVFIVRRELFRKAGGFYEGYGKGYFEDVDLCITLRMMGSHIYINTQATADHYTNASMMKINEPIPMNQNRQILLSRRGNQLIHDSWSFM